MLKYYSGIDFQNDASLVLMPDFDWSEVLSKNHQFENHTKLRNNLDGSLNDRVSHRIPISIAL